MFRFAQQNSGRIRRIAAHRQTWLNSEALDLTSSTKLQMEQHILSDDLQQASRYKDQYGAQRASIAIYDLLDAENTRARRITAAVDAGDLEAARRAATAASPVATINELLQQSNIPIKLHLESSERIMASREGGPSYSAAELSDGERNALLIAASVLTAPPGMCILIDEPERHLHRSITSPLLRLLFQRRSDCAFVISTHDLDLPIDAVGSKTLLLRSCNFTARSAQSWEADILSSDMQIDDVLKRDLLGARRRILFVEGTEQSLDKPLYSILFPMVSVVAKGNCREVENAVVGVRSGEELHWLSAYGIADGDGYDQEQVKAKLERGVFSLPYYSVEALYFHPAVIAFVAERKAALTGEDGSELTKRAIDAALASIAPETERLSRKVAMKVVRTLILDQLPNDDQLLDGVDVKVTNGSPDILRQRKHQLDEAVAQGDWEAVLNMCSVRESRALTEISAKLGFRRREDYEQAVRHMLSVDKKALEFVRRLFGSLYNQLYA
jgi:hypothetical protein